MSKHPYQSQPPTAFWRKAVSELVDSEVDPVVSGSFRLTANDKVATAGSCFAQHISRYLSKVGFRPYVTETVHPIARDFATPEFNYGVYTARYGNIYSSRQLLQLFHRCYKSFIPVDVAWNRSDGSLVDPFRPQISPDGYMSVAELIADREHHFHCVRTAFENLDVLVFTLGLTEIWFSKQDGAVFPICPGVLGGVFEDSKYGFANLRVDDVVADISAFVGLLGKVNPSAKVLLTVSPVPLIATAETRHVLLSNTYSKSALRVACDELVSRHDNVFYFPSFEIITASFSRGRYYSSDAREVNEDGVDHVMRLFLKHYVGNEDFSSEVISPEFEVNFERVVQVICEEEALSK